MITLSPICENRLEQVHPDLVSIVRASAAAWPSNGTSFRITCGARTIAEQKRLVETGASRTMRSRHLIAQNGYSHAVDIAIFVDGKIRWDWPLYVTASQIFKKSALALAIPLEWGGDWTSFRDGPHYQLPWKTHAGGMNVAEIEQDNELAVA